MTIFEQNINILFNFFSNHFELILYIHAAGLLVLLFLIIMVDLRDKTIRTRLYDLLRNVFFISLLSAEMCMIVLSLYVYWINYHRPAKEVKFSDKFLPTTQWVQTNTPLYYIEKNNLRSMTASDRKQGHIFKGQNPLRGYYFSPDGKYLLVLDTQGLYLVDLFTNKSELVTSLALEKSSAFTAEDQINENEDLRSAIHAIRWAPDSQKFCYEIALWTPFSSREHIYVYSLRHQKKLEVKSPLRKISSLYWDTQGENLYYLYNEAKDTSVTTYSYGIKVFRIPVERGGELIASAGPEFITEIASPKASLPLDHLKLRGVELFLRNDELSFERSTHKSLFASSLWESQEINHKILLSIVSKKGKVLGLDRDDYLYYIPNRWFKKRLFKIPREPVVSDVPHYAYKGGEPVIYNIRWLPGGRYAILEHKYGGVFILEPYTGKVGYVVGLHGEAIGWFEAMEDH